MRPRSAIRTTRCVIFKILGGPCVRNLWMWFRNCDFEFEFWFWNHGYVGGGTGRGRAGACGNPSGGWVATRRTWQPIHRMGCHPPNLATHPPDGLPPDEPGNPAIQKIGNEPGGVDANAIHDSQNKISTRMVLVLLLGRSSRTTPAGPGVGPDRRRAMTRTGAGAILS